MNCLRDCLLMDSMEPLITWCQSTGSARLHPVVYHPQVIVPMMNCVVQGNVIVRVGAVACEKVDVCGAFDDELRGARKCDCTGAVTCEKVDVCGGFDDELRGARKCDCTGAVACEKVDVCGGFDDELRG
eukprot:57438_1